MYCEALLALHLRSSDPTRSRLGGGAMEAPQGRWEGPIQKVCNMRAGAFTPWQQVAQDKQAWQELEALFVQTLVPRRRASEVPQGRWMIGHTPPS